MINREKILVMTKLAIYEKNYGETDKKANEYFRHDYIYKKNFWTRLFALLGCFIIMLFYVINKVIVEETDIFLLNYTEEGTRAVIFIIAVLSLYTVISSVIASRQYSESQKRLKRQFALMKRLDNMQASRTRPMEDTLTRPIKEDAALYYGTDIGDTGNFNKLL